MAIGTVPTFLQNASHSASIFRIAQSAPFTTGGILASNELPVSQQGTPNMSVILGPGRSQVTGTSVSPPAGQAWSTQAQYTAYNDANLTLTIATSNPTNPRIDAVYIQIQDSFYSGATNTAVAAVATGTPAVSPVAPAVPANSLLIAYVAVGANVTTIVTANITFMAAVASLLLPSPSVCDLSNTQSIANNTVLTLGSAGIAYTENADVLNWHDAVTNPTRITPTKAGRYRVLLAVGWGSNATGLRYGALGLNGVYAGNRRVVQTATVDGNGTTVVVAEFVMNGTTDYLEAQVFQTSGGALAVAASFVVTFIG